MLRFGSSIVVAACLVAACAAAAAPASTPSLRVRPTVAARGTTVRFAGSVGTGCARGNAVTLISKLFPNHAFGGAGAIYATVRAGGLFSRRYVVPRRTPRGRYRISARCGGGNLGVTARVRVT